MLLSFGALIHGHRKLGAWIKRYEPNTRLMDWLRIWAIDKGWDHIYSSMCFREAANVISCLGTLCKTKRHALGLSWSSQAETQNCPIDDSKQLLRYPRIEYLRYGRVSASLPAVEGEAHKDPQLQCGARRDSLPDKEMAMLEPKMVSIFHSGQNHSLASM